MTDEIGEWSRLSRNVTVGQELSATVLRVDRWGLLLDLGLPFKGFMDRLQAGDNLDQYRPGTTVDVIVTQLADYNRQIRVRPRVCTAES